jgi:methylated-DNA-[protein]-cysteine S-methyltransferase
MQYWTAVELAPGFAFFLASEGGEVKRAAFSKSAARPPRGWKAAGRNDRHPVLARAVKQLKEYFAGKRRAFTVPFQADGTHFQCEVWQALCGIPFGEVRTYGDVALAAGHPRAARAVGGANRANPIPIFIPCHRVVASGGALGGFSAGLGFKRKLLELEGAAL